MFAGTQVPVTSTKPPDPNSLDKWLHAGAFAGLAFLLAAVGRVWGARGWRLSVGVVVIVALYGVFDEITQSLVRRREADLFDWLADMGGALVGIAAFSLCAKPWTAQQGSAAKD